MCSLKWFRPTRSRVISLILPLQLSRLKILLGEDLINLRILPLKTPKLFEFRRDLNCSIQWLWKERRSFWISCIVFGDWGLLFFFIFCKTFLVFCTYVINEVIINLILGKFFLGVPHIAPLITKQTLYWRNSSFLMKGHFTCLIIIKKHHHDRDGVWLKFYIIWLVGILAAMCFWDDNTYVFNLDDDRELLALSNTNAEWDIYFAMWLKTKWLLQLVL